ncbi:MAG: molybdate ABC transporter substrate-binding protein [Nitrospinae bacterium]|jgi:molybdate transport system substrate-binding protein|nr:molybdate ABC transporter substrate-binding protein [Nitrospinota bacterium]MDA1109499.1 molybdate ABC transporter substrate-binding protein [Nitrospinota bacterium]
MRFVLFIIMIFPLSGVYTSAQAGEVHVAVASNFINPLKAIARHFEQETGHRVVVIPGSTGKLYVQIKNGAPFDLLLAADDLRPRLLEEEGFAVPGSRFTYAIGQLTLWSRDPRQINGEGAKIFQNKNFNFLAMANPKGAPYGRAAFETLKKLGVWDQLQGKVVQGENIGQTFQFVATGNAELGFVALSQVLDPKNKFKGSRWDVPTDLHDPIAQDLVLLKRGAGNPAAIALLDFIRGATARKIIIDYGYQLN